MEARRNRVSFFASYLIAARNLPDAERLRWWDGLAEYAFCDIEPDFSDSALLSTCFALAQPNIDKSKGDSDNGAKGGRPPKTPLKTGVKTPLKSGIGEGIGIGIGIGEGIEGGKPPCKAKRFAPPTPAQVSDYCKEHGYKVDSTRFVAYYSANGWKVGRNQMKDWRAAVRNWHYRDNPSKTGAVMVDEFSKYN